MRASRRTRFVEVVECTVLYDHPCGCEGSKYRLADGCLNYSYDGMGTLWDLFECRQCGAVWTLADAPPFTWETLWSSFAPSAVNVPSGLTVDNEAVRN